MEWINTVLIPTIASAVQAVVQAIVQAVMSIVNFIINALNNLASLIVGQPTAISLGLSRAIAYNAIALMVVGIAMVLTESDTVAKLFKGLTILFLVLVLFAAFTVGTWLQGLLFALGVVSMMYLGLYAVSMTFGSSKDNPYDPSSNFGRNVGETVRDTVDFIRDVGSDALGIPKWPAWVWWLGGGTVAYIVLRK